MLAEVVIPSPAKPIGSKEMYKSEHKVRRDPERGWPGSLARPEQRLYPLETARQMLRRILYVRTVLRIQ